MKEVNEGGGPIPYVQMAKEKERRKSLERCNSPFSISGYGTRKLICGPRSRSLENSLSGSNDLLTSVSSSGYATGHSARPSPSREKQTSRCIIMLLLCVIGLLSTLIVISYCSGGVNKTSLGWTEFDAKIAQLRMELQSQNDTTNFHDMSTRHKIILEDVTQILTKQNITSLPSNTKIETEVQTTTTSNQGNTGRTTVPTNWDNFPYFEDFSILEDSTQSPPSHALDFERNLENNFEYENLVEQSAIVFLSIDQKQNDLETPEIYHPRILRIRVHRGSA